VGGVSLKDFQRRVLEQLERYITELRRQQASTVQQAEALRMMDGAEETLRQLADCPRHTWEALRKAGALPPPLHKDHSTEHHSRWDGAGRAIPNVCLKVPTGGGKTLLAAAAVGQILQGWLRRSTGLVLWVVPNEAIYTQTPKALANRELPYRQLLNVAGAGRVKVLEKTHPLTRQDVDGHLCVMLRMLAGAARRRPAQQGDAEVLCRQRPRDGLPATRRRPGRPPCAAAGRAQLDALQREAEALQGETARCIRPILLVQVERTEADLRDAGFIHAEDAREHLLALGLQPRHIAIKTSERNDLAAPENIDLLSPSCEVRAIITKQALQEGWDCPFAYVLCTLAAGRNLAAMTQLVGRVLRLPQVAKTGRPALDACYVLCHDAETGKVVEAIRKSLEGEGMGDLGSAVRGGDADPESPRPVKQQRRGAWQGTRIVVPRVTWVQPDGQRRDLEYDSDVLAGLDWQAAQPAQWVANWAPDAQPRSAQQMDLGLELLKGGAPQAAVETGGAATMLDRARVVRALAAPARGWISAAHAPSSAVGPAGAAPRSRAAPAPRWPWARGRRGWRR
jgi:hypothetical protein